MYLGWSSMIWKCPGWWCESRCQSTAWCSAAAWWRPAWCPAPPPPRRWGGAWLAPAPARRPATRPPPGGGAARGAACSVLQTCRRCFTIGYTHTHNAPPLDSMVSHFVECILKDLCDNQLRYLSTGFLCPVHYEHSHGLSNIAYCTSVVVMCMLSSKLGKGMWRHEEAQLFPATSGTLLRDTESPPEAQ